MKLFEQLHIKFLIIPLIAVGSLLAVTFCTIFGITYYKTTTELTDKVHSVSSTLTITKDPSTTGRAMIIYITEQNGQKTYTHYNSYEYTSSQIDFIAANLEKEKAYLKVDNKRVLYELGDSKIIDNKKITSFAIIDCTEQYQTISTLGLTLLVVYIVSLAIIAFLSYILATSATKPVKEAFEKEKALIANASHELKTPLTVAKTNLDLVVSNPNISVQENLKWIESARYQIDRMSNLVLQMLELSKIEREGYQVEKTNLDLSSIIEGILLSFEAACYENNIRFVSDIQPNIYYNCNAIETEKLITILVDNAIKYTPLDGEIAVTMAKTLKNISIKVTNTGAGIPPEKLKRIFERFYKLDESHKESGNSFGLGLSIAKLIVTSMGGDISCYSEVNKYTTFEILLPIH